MPQHDLTEQLAQTHHIRHFIQLACDELANQLDQLIERVFRKTDFALKSVVDSLFEHKGPLAELSVRLKLLLGLGVISPQVFEDISLFLEFKHHLNDEQEEPVFSHPAVIQFAKDLHFVDFSLISELLKQKPNLDNKDSMLVQMHQMRLEKVVRSSLVLALMEIGEQLDVESPL